MYYVYILKLVNGDYYSGSTSDLDSRLDDHKYGRNKSTKHFRPLSLVWTASFSNKKQALEFEKYLKSSSGHAFRNKRLV